MRPRCLGAFGLLTLAAVATSASAETGLPAPEEVGSHAAYLEALHEAESSLAAELLARYERRIAEAPDDAIAAIERCRFLALAFYDPDTEENLRADEHQACVEDLRSRFAENPDARVFAIEDSWGEEARDLGETFLEAPPPGTQSRHLAAVHTHLARQLEFQDSMYAAAHAEQAMALDPALDLRLMLARGERDSGDLESARAALVEGLLATNDDWMLAQKAELLVELEDFESALTAFRELESRGGIGFDRGAYARALAGAGEVAEARTEWARAAEDWLSDELLRERFDFELIHGTGATARAAYDALRARNALRDVFGLDRLALLLAHPDAPWKPQDATPLLVFALVAFGITLVPALWILPVAWAGLARDRRANPAKSTAGFGLHQAWAVSALYLLATVVPVMIQFEKFADARAAGATQIGESLYAKYTLLNCLGGLAAVLLVVRGKIAALLGRGRWPLWRVALASVLGVLALRTGVALWLAAMGSAEGEAVTNEMVRAVNDRYGVNATLLLIAMVTPLAEELIFRGVLLSAFQRALGPHWANFAQAALFGLFHADPILTPFTFAMGMLGGWMTLRSGTLWPALLMHALNNAVSCAAMVASA